jgi:hypothetical protein
MKRKTLLTILIVIIVAGGIGAGVAYNMWNKPHSKVEDEKGIAISADDLCREFGMDEMAANTKYLGKAVNVSGKVVKQEMNQEGALVVTVQGNDPDLSVQCTMRDKNEQLDSGSNVVLKGYSSGGDMFGALLTDCIVK